jgi:hypothetical protein
MRTTDWIIAIAAIVNAASVIALTFVTVYYARITKRILEESHKAREAAERQANAAQDNIRFLQHELEEQIGLGRITVQSAIDSAVASILYWRKLPLSDLSRASSLPNPDNLLPGNLSAVLEHARRTSVELGQFVSDGFQNLQMAKNEIERVKNANAAIKTGFYNDKPSEADGYLAEGLSMFQEAEETLDRIP